MVYHGAEMCNITKLERGVPRSWDVVCDVPAIGGMNGRPVFPVCVVGFSHRKQFVCVYRPRSRSSVFVYSSRSSSFVVLFQFVFSAYKIIHGLFQVASTAQPFLPTMQPEHEKSDHAEHHAEQLHKEHGGLGGWGRQVSGAVWTPHKSVARHER